jgi:hypothetical protein
MSGEVVLNPSEKPKLTREEATAAMGLILGDVMSTIDTKASQFAPATKIEVENSLYWLEERAKIMAAGIHKTARPTKLYSFIEWLSLYPELIVATTEERIDSALELAELVDRVGVAIQGNMIVNKLLTETSKKQLKELESSRMRARIRGLSS